MKKTIFKKCENFPLQFNGKSERHDCEICYCQVRYEICFARTNNWVPYGWYKNKSFSDLFLWKKTGKKDVRLNCSTVCPTSGMDIK
jgi:Zn-finger protein